MGKRIILALTLCVCVLYGSSQKSNFGGGIVLGNNFSGMSADNIPGYWKAGIQVGIITYVKIVESPNVRMLLQMDVDFAMKGTRTKPNFYATGLARKDKYALSLGYIDIPIFLRMRFNDTKKSNDGLWFDFGPCFSFFLYQRTVARTHRSTQLGTGSYGMSLHDLYNFNRLDFSMTGGVSYIFKHHHGLAFRYSHSLLPAGTTKQEVTMGVFRKLYNSAFSMIYTWQF